MKISKRDWTHLSSYLDGELSQRESQRLEERIKKDPVLRFALDELRQTKKILKHTPRLKIPRNFTLTPEMVGIKSTSKAVRGYRLAAAMMSFLLIGVLVLDFGRIFIGGAMAPAMPKELMWEVLPESAADTIEEPALLAAEAQVEVDEEADRAVSEAEGELFQEEAAPAVSAESMEEGEAAGMDSVGEEKSAGEAVRELSNDQEDSTQDKPDEEQSTNTQTLDPQPTAPVYYPEEEIITMERTPGLSTFRVLEILLGVGVLGFMFAAWFKNRRKS